MPRILPVVAAALLLSGCAGPAPPPRPHLVLSGPRLYQPLLSALSRKFLEKAPEIRIDHEISLVGRAVADAREGLADVAILGRDLRPDETGVTAHPIARDGIVLLVHKSNTIANLTEAQVAGLFTRLYVNWREVGGSDRPVTLIGLSEGRSTREAFLDLLTLRGVQVRPDVTVGSSDQAAAATATRPGGIAYASLAGSRQALQSGAVRAVPLDGVSPSTETISTGRYPFIRPVILVSRSEPSEAVQRFLDFARSEEAHPILVELGFVPGGGP
jgi:phosphate transport system substrate-binding protein